MFSAANFPNTVTPAYKSAPFASAKKMDPSVSIKREKNKGKSKKNKKDKKEKTKKEKEKEKEKEKQPVSIDLTSPTRAQEHILPLVQMLSLPLPKPIAGAFTTEWQTKNHTTRGTAGPREFVP